MRLAEDRRARVPFALIAVVLLSSSLAFATALSTREPPRVDRAIDESLDRVDAETRLAIRAAAAEAAGAAAREPVTSAADTPAGRVLNDSRPFRDALELRLYLRARDQLTTTRYRHDDVTARASLPATPNAAALRSAKRRVDVSSVANGTAMRVTVRNVTLRAERGGETVASEEETYTVTVDTPVLALHDRASSFEDRLNRGPTAGPGLGRQLTARLYPITWLRGGLQYGGAPIQNVVTDRHVALAANGGVLATQRAAFGRTDPDATDAYGRARKRTAMTDVLAPTPLDGELTAAVLDPPVAPGNRSRPDQSRRSSDVAGLERSSRPAPDAAVVVGVNRSADRALVAVHDDPGLASLLAEQYRATVRIETRVERVQEPTPTASPPGEDWTLAGVDARRTRSVEAAPAPLPVAPDGRRLRSYTREVRQRIRIERTWRRGDETTVTTADHTRVTRVGIAVVGEHDPPGRAPDRPVAPLFRSGGAVDGANLARADREAQTLIANRGGPDAIARRVADGEHTDETTTVERRPSPALEPWVRRDLLGLRAAVRNVSVTVDRGTVAAGEANPPRRLADRLRDRRAELLAAPATYDGVADRARVAVRAAYFDAVVADLERRAAAHERRNRQLTDAIDEATPRASPDPGAILDVRTRAERPERRVIGANRSEGDSRTGAVTVVPDGEPAYLTRSAVTRGPSGESYPPLATRNLNLFTVPYGDAVDVAIDGAASGETVSLATAGRTLIAADGALDSYTTRLPEQQRSAETRRELETRRGKLHGHVRSGITDARSAAGTVLGREDVLDAEEAATVIAAAEARYGRDGRLAIAIANGSFARAIAARAAVRGDLTRAEQAVLAARLRVAFAETLDTQVRVPASAVEQTAGRVREISRQLLEATAKDAAGNLTRQAAERALGDDYSGIPAGLPVLPVPGYWIATVNVWHVQVRGTYGRFTLRARDGSPARRGGTTYVRDGSAVTLDVDGDGTGERLGRSDRISFETSTVVVIAVPPSGRGVGDVDGNADERSTGWPCPGPAGADGPPCTETETPQS